MLDQVPVPLTDKELAAIQAIAERDGISVDEAASRLVSEQLARRVRRNTGKAPAKIYTMRRRK